MKFRDSILERCFVALFLLAMILVGASMLVQSVNAIWLGCSAKYWPTTTCTISESTIRACRVKRGTKYKAIVTYSFTVDGKRFVGDTIYAGQYATGERAARKLANKYSAGSSSTVRYYPENPEYAVLETGSDNNILFLVFFGRVFLGAGTSAAFAYYRKLYGGAEC